jgi:exosortase
MSSSEDQSRQAERPAGKSLADLVAPDEQRPFLDAFPVSTLVKIGVLAVLFVALNGWQFPALKDKWVHDPNWTFGFIIPLFSLYLLYARWGEFMDAQRRVALTGLPLMVLSVVFIVVSYVFFRVRWLSNLGMVALLLSLVIYLGGWQVAKLAWLPIAFLAFAMPFPEMLYTRIAVPLQELAAHVSALVLKMSGAVIQVTASALTITSVTGQIHHVTVAEACSGVRSLIAFVAMGVAWAYLVRRPIWQRVVIVLAAVPIAILCNVLRVTITCGMFVVDQPEMGEGFMHEFTGMLMLAPALVVFWALGKLLESLFVEVETEEEPASAASVADGSEE